MLHLPDTINEVYTTYVGIQQHVDSDDAVEATKEVIKIIKAWVAKEDGPAAHESFTILDDSNAKDVAIWVCYWTEPEQHKSSLDSLALASIYSDLPPQGQSAIGLWQESFSTAVSRLETNYSGLDYLPGLARLPEASTKEHTLSAYWGAARDRIPDSAHDLFPPVAHEETPKETPRGIGQHLVGTNHDNLVHIRSGQFWENCGQQEADAYERKLEPTLEAGLQYLRDHADETGSMGLRYMRNADLPANVNDRPRKETCGAGFFTNLKDLERWAHTHKSHLKIFNGALAHYKEFGDMRRFRTWHEVSVIREGKATFDYVNCNSREGMGNAMAKWTSIQPLRRVLPT
jgi:hypothetical protein